MQIESFWTGKKWTSLGRIITKRWPQLQITAEFNQLRCAFKWINSSARLKVKAGILKILEKYSIFWNWKQHTLGLPCGENQQNPPPEGAEDGEEVFIRTRLGAAICRRRHQLTGDRFTVDLTSFEDHLLSLNEPAFADEPSGGFRQKPAIISSCHNFAVSFRG